jgi:hypothetical protein
MNEIYVQYFENEMRDRYKTSGICIYLIVLRDPS